MEEIEVQLRTFSNRIAMKRKHRIRNLSLPARLSLLRGGHLTPNEIADVAADFGTENFIEARPDVERLLDHPDPIVRYNAMATLAYEWATTDRTDKLIEILLHDSDNDCRRQAAGALGSLFCGGRDLKIAKVLAGVVTDPAEEDGVRHFAYAGLLDVLGVEMHYQPDPVSMSLDDVDWNLVEKCKQDLNPETLDALATQFLAGGKPRDTREDMVRTIRELKQEINEALKSSAAAHRRYNERGTAADEPKRKRKS